MTQTAAKPQPETLPEQGPADISFREISSEDSRQWQAYRLRLIWGHRRLFVQATAIGLLLSALVAFLLPERYTSTTQLMPPDAQSTSSMAMMAAFAAKGGSLGSVAGDLPGVKTTGAEPRLPPFPANAAIIAILEVDCASGGISCV